MASIRNTTCLAPGILLAAYARISGGAPLSFAPPTISVGTWMFAMRAPNDINRTEKRHRVSVLRAARKERMTDWTWWIGENRGNTLVFYNYYDPRSYTIARLKADMFNFYRNKEDIKAMLDPSGKRYDLVKEGGAWWRHVQLRIAKRDGDTSDRALQLKADQEKDDRRADMASSAIKSLLRR